MASQVLYQGDWYNCIDDAAAGQSPGTHPAKWSRLEIPAQFERFLTQSAFERLLPGEGQNDKRRGERGISAEILLETWMREVNQTGRQETIRSVAYSR